MASTGVRHSQAAETNIEHRMEGYRSGPREPHAIRKLRSDRKWLLYDLSKTQRVWEISEAQRREWRAQLERVEEELAYAMRSLLEQDEDEMRMQQRMGDLCVALRAVGLTSDEIMATCYGIRMAGDLAAQQMALMDVCAAYGVLDVLHGEDAEELVVA